MIINNYLDLLNFVKTEKSKGYFIYLKTENKTLSYFIYSAKLKITDEKWKKEIAAMVEIDRNFWLENRKAIFTIVKNYY